MYKSIISNVTFNVSKYASVINQDLDHTTNILSNTIHKIVDKTEGLNRHDVIQVTLEEVLKELYSQQQQIWLIYVDDAPVSFAFTKEVALKRMKEFSNKIRLRQFVINPTVRTYIEDVNDEEIRVIKKSTNFFDQPQRYCSISIDLLRNVNM